MIKIINDNHKIKMLEEFAKRPLSEIIILTEHLSDIRLARSLMLASENYYRWLNHYGNRRKKITRKAYSEYIILWIELERRLIESNENKIKGDSIFCNHDINDDEDINET